MEELLRIENGGNELVLLRDKKGYALKFDGKLDLDHYLGKQVVPTSIIYSLKPGDVEEIMHALIDRDKL